ncbi:Copper amine oxidase N-terminal domain-containing protein [Paenibacillus sp. OK060]|uniref:stalk domain-containing protein n=1 Tax=Paenibacillus sp. OK060 TaxID=1881034 RepID=UPI0008861FFD|nr:stalk domain-containing protein [Paenibacillus sp. OK060]SDM15450.1 Copper amine oxidase N-terminal domain-containing protein [Paenibacillus sp. OK060]
MKDKVKGLVVGILIGSTITGATAFAASGISVKAVIQKVNLYVDGTKKTTANAITYNNTTYVPVRSMSSALGQNVALRDNNLYIGKIPKLNITEKEAVKLVKNKYGYNSSYLIVEVDNELDNQYVVHVYEVVIDDEKTGEGHTATYGWYYVDKSSGKISSMF